MLERQIIEADRTPFERSSSPRVSTRTLTARGTLRLRIALAQLTHHQARRRRRAVARGDQGREDHRIAIFRFDHKAVEALIAAAERGVRVTALIAVANRGGAKSLRKLELRFLDAGIIVARTADDLVRYHGKYILIDRCVLYVLSFNFTSLDINHSRGFGLVTSRPEHVQEAARLFKADCTRIRYGPKVETFVVSPSNARQVLGAFIKRAKKQLLIYDPGLSDKEMIRLLQDRAKAGVEIKVIGKVSGKSPFDVQKLDGPRLHTRTLIRDRRQAFVGSQSLRAAELDSRREVGLIVQEAKVVKRLIETFESDWTRKGARKEPVRPDVSEAPAEAPDAASPKEIAKSRWRVHEELQPLATTVKGLRRASSRPGRRVLNDKDVRT